MRFVFVLICIQALFFLSLANIASAEKAPDNIAHPLLLFNEGEARLMARQADCAVLVVEKGSAGVPENDLKAISCLKAIKEPKRGKITKFGADATLTTKNANIDNALAVLGLFAIRSMDEKEILHYGMRHAWLFAKVDAQYNIPTEPEEIDDSPKEVVAKKICSNPKHAESTNTYCGPLSGKARSFRRSFRRLFQEHRKKARNEPVKFDYVRFFGFFVEDLANPNVIDELKDAQGKLNFKYPDERTACPKMKASDTHDRSKDYIYRAVMNCSRTDVTGDPNYQVLIAYEPGSSLEDRQDELVILANAPKQPWIVGVREGAGALLSTKFNNKESVFPSSGELRLAKNPDEFLKSKTESGITLGVGVDRNGAQEDFEIDAAIGYRLANKIKPTTDCDNPGSFFCRTQFSVTPFLAWQRETSDDLSVTPAQKDRNRDVVFTGVQYGVEKITQLEKADIFSDNWVRPNWRVTGALEAITDGDFDAEVYRATGKFSPPGPDKLPHFGYRQPVRLVDLLRSHQDYRQRARKNEDALDRCTNRALCSVWVQWDGGIVFEGVSIIQAPLDLSTDDDLEDRLFQFDGLRAGYDLSAKVGTRSLFAFKSDKPWVELSVDYKNRQSWNASGGQAELFETSLKLKDTFEGLFSVGISYERGEELRLGNEIENWTLEFDMKR